MNLNEFFKGQCEEVLRMKSVFGIALLIMTCAPCRFVNAQSSQTVVIKNATVIDGTGRAPIKDAVIVIEGNRVKQVGAKSRIVPPKNAPVIDATGKFVIPGLADMHHHLGNGFFIPGPGRPTQNPRQNLAQLLGWGFTTIHCPAHTDSALATAARDDAAPLPRLWGVGENRGFSTEGGHAARFGNILPKTLEEAREKVRSVGPAAGVDAIKIVYSDQSHRRGPQPLAVMKPEIMQALIDEAHKMGLKAYVHAPTLRHAKEALRAGADVLVHSVADAPVDAEFIALMKQNRATYITTLALYICAVDVAAWMRRLEEMDERKIIPKEVYERFGSEAGAKDFHAWSGVLSKEQAQYLGKNLRTIYDAGIPVLAGTDTSVPGVLLGVSSQMELALMVEGGLTPAEALRTATINAAKFLGREKEQGTVEAGKLADLVILDANPLADIRNIRRIHRVIKGGVVYDPATLLTTTK